MSLNGNYTPLNLNVLGAFLNNNGLTINSVAAQFMGTSDSISTHTKGFITNNTVLSQLVDAIDLAYPLIGNDINTQIPQSVYDNLISIGANSIPALGNSKPSTYNSEYLGEATRFGFLRLIALLAHYELNVNGVSSYSTFVSTFNTCNSYRLSNNKVINSFITARTFMDGSFSNMNDLITSDITGVSLATLYWGQDLINTGRVIDLSQIDNFGTPSVLLKTIQKNNAITKSLGLALLTAGLTSSTVDKILNGQAVTLEQEKQIYTAFSIIVGLDLKEICTPLNCQIQGLTSLADLIDPKKLFPNSYATLTVARYNATKNPTNSKAYFLLYKGNAPNIVRSLGYGTKLRNILPEPLAYVCEAFSSSMQQIKNIKQVNIEKFSQVVANLENVQTLPTGATSTPTNQLVANAGLATIAQGLGPSGTYTMCDFFGAMSGLSYQWKTLYQLLSNVGTTELQAIYSDIYTLVSGPGPYTNLQSLIDSANTEISNILTNNNQTANLLNAVYDNFGLLLYKEQVARLAALPNLGDITSSPQDLYVFLDNLQTYASETQDYGAGRVLEAIAHTTTTGGNSLIGSMREMRNSLRLGLAGLKLDNDVTSETVPKPRTGVTPGYTNPGLAARVPIVTGAANIPGSLAGSPEATLIPDNLSVVNIPSTVLTPAEAIHEVTLCNCDCWDDL